MLDVVAVHRIDAQTYERTSIDAQTYVAVHRSMLPINLLEFRAKLANFAAYLSCLMPSKDRTSPKYTLTAARFHESDSLHRKTDVKSPQPPASSFVSTYMLSHTLVTTLLLYTITAVWQAFLYKKSLNFIQFNDFANIFLYTFTRMIFSIITRLNNS